MRSSSRASALSAVSAFQVLVGGPLEGVRRWLPQGNLLPDDIWRQRHRVIVALLWLHIPGLFVVGLAAGLAPLHIVSEVTVVAIAASAASSKRAGRGVRSAIATIGLITCSAILVHFSGGYVEAHFHFFVMLGVITLYQSWIPFLLALAYVIVHHGVLGTLYPTAVYNHPDAWANPWKWALIHGGFVFAASGAYLAAWRLTEYQALHDPLTRLPNRALYHDRVLQAGDRAARRASKLVVMLLDLDDFKKVNDTLGHGAGDELLVAVSRRLKTMVRTVDTVARLGGDEFGILVEEVSDRRMAQTVADRVLRTFDEPFVVRERPTVVRASLGVTLGTRGDCEVDELIRRADVAMYLAKGAGSHGYVFSQDSLTAA
jgi:diguanylate cyclase (GGDEF)-like protein